MKKLLPWILLMLAGTLLWFAAVQTQQQRMSEKLLRLHVVANSDSEYDQAVKLQVRDAVLSVTEGLETKQAVARALPEILAAAQNASQGQPVQVTMAYEEFPARAYESFSLPAGVYPALRVTLGEGKGQNWWCVVFPSLCLRAAAEVETAAEAAGFTKSELRLITEPEYQFRFKTLELLQRLRNWLRTQ